MSLIGWRAGEPEDLGGKEPWRGWQTMEEVYPPWGLAPECYADWLAASTLPTIVWNLLLQNRAIFDTLEWCGPWRPCIQCRRRFACYGSTTFGLAALCHMPLLLWSCLFGVNRRLLWTRWRKTKRLWEIVTTIITFIAASSLRKCGLGTRGWLPHWLLSGASVSLVEVACSAAKLCVSCLNVSLMLPGT